MKLLRIAYRISWIKPSVQERLLVGEGQNGSLTFTAKDNKQTLQISAGSKELQNALGITSTQSNKISTGSSLWENRDKLGLEKYNTKEKLNNALKNFTVNGAKIDNITADTTVDGLLTAINNNKDAGVTATYLGSENKFVLSSNRKKVRAVRSPLVQIQKILLMQQISFSAG